MSPRFLRRRAAGSGLLLAAFLATPALAADLEWLRLQTVHIQVERTDQPGNETGSGVLLCQVDKKAYVLTAQHVIFGKTPDGKLKKTRDAKKITLSFYKRAAEPVVEVVGLSSVFNAQQFPDMDLLLLSFEVKEDLAAFAKPSPMPPAEDILNGPQHTVQAIGYRWSTTESWAAAHGDIRRRGGGYLHHSAAIEGGFSGGPLFDDKTGAWIGLNIQASADKSTPGGLALSIEKILDAINKGVPANFCLPRADEIKAQEANDLYRIAMRHVSLREWKQAKEVLWVAITLNPLEGGSVHLQGMRYTEYLPHFHLALALYHQGCYGESLRELQVSEVQGVIRDNKRFKDLKRIYANCQKKIEAKVRALGSQTTTTAGASRCAPEEIQKNLTREIEAMRVLSE